MIRISFVGTGSEQFYMSEEIILIKPRGHNIQKKV